MADFRVVTEDFAVAPQISPDDVAVAARQGYRLIVNNRPDGEAPGQPTSEAIAAAARAAGLDYIHIPIVGRPTADQAAAVRRATAGAGGGTLAFCRTGTRSILAWTLGEALAGARTGEELIAVAARAGYDVSGMLTP